MGDKCNCYRFSPRDSLSGAVAQIADYLSKHPGWNETELRTFVDGLISSAGVETFNGRSGNVTLNKDDVNNLLIANCYFAEADETIESIDVLALYKLGIRIVFTQYSSEVGGYTLAYGIEYYPATDTAKAYLFSSGSGGGTGAIVSVNGKTGTVVLNASDILMNDGDTVERAVNGARSVADGAATDATNALNKANAAYSADNAPPYPVTSVNGKTGSVTGLYDSDNQPPYPVTSVNGKTGSVTGLYDSDNQPPYPVTSVNGKTGVVTGLYDVNNPPPYPVTSVDYQTGSVVTVKSFFITNESAITLNPGVNVIYFTVSISGLPYGNRVNKEFSGYSTDYPIYGAVASTDGAVDNGQCSVRAFTYKNKVIMSITNESSGYDFTGSVGIFLICPVLRQISFTAYIGDEK